MESLNQEEWLQTFLYIQREELLAPDQRPRYDLQTKDAIKEDRRYINMIPLFATDPRLQTVLEDPGNLFVDSSFKEYHFKDENHDDQFEKKLDNVEFIIGTCGQALSVLNIEGQDHSGILKLIKIKCPNLSRLEVRLNETENNDFNDLFINIHNLKMLRLTWLNDYLPLPSSLIDSMKQVEETLEILLLSYIGKNENFLPKSLAPVFARFFMLKKLNIHFFGLDQQLIESISKMKNLKHLDIMFPQIVFSNNIIFNDIDMSPIGLLKHLKSFRVDRDYGINDQFLINLSNSCHNFKELFIIATYITDEGIIALSKSESITVIDLGLKREKNHQITDTAIICLKNPNLKTLNISGCANISNNVIKPLLINLEQLETLWVKYTKVNHEITKRFHRELPGAVYRRVSIFVTFSDRYNYFEYLKTRKNLLFVSLNPVDLDYSEIISSNSINPEE